MVEMLGTQQAAIDPTVAPFNMQMHE